MSVSSLKALLLLVILGGLAVTPVKAQDDAAGVKAASDAFYSALRARDINALEAAWADADYVTLVQPVGPQTIIIGRDAVRVAFEMTFSRQAVAVTLSTIAIIDPVVQIRDSVAWEIGLEGNPAQPVGATNGAMTTNIYEKIDGQWLMVAHIRHPSVTVPAAAP